MDDSTYFNDSVAELVDADGRFVYVLVGSILDRSELPAGQPVEILVSEDAVIEYPACYLPILEFLKVPRKERQVSEFINLFGGDKKILKHLVKSKIVVRVHTRDPLTATKSLKGLRIIPQCIYIGDVQNINLRGLINVKKDETSTDGLVISMELGEYLWHGDGYIPDIYHHINQHKKLPRDEKRKLAGHLIHGLDILFTHDYARLEWVNLKS